jgi:hypothetical protein
MERKFDAVMKGRLQLRPSRGGNKLGHAPCLGVQPYQIYKLEKAPDRMARGCLGSETSDGAGGPPEGVTELGMLPAQATNKGKKIDLDALEVFQCV